MYYGHLLNRISCPDDLKKLTKDQINSLCAEIREKLIHTISNNGGHLASNLGVVELTVALHLVFDSPKDQIVWDVGHQSYVHKLLTGRSGQFETIRKFGGLSGFPKIHESKYDSYGTGHSSTAISAACGLAEAKKLMKDDGYVIAVVGDGALTGGLAYEGLNNVGRSKDKIIIVLNDNKMSISKNVGAIARHLAVIRSKSWYFKVKDTVERVLSHSPFIGKKIRGALVKSKSALKNILYHSTIFEEMGLVYLGPVDGHNIDDMSRLLKRAKSINRPAIVHVMTVKGKGYTFAEQNPRAYHGVSKFDIETGDPIGKVEQKTFSEIFGEELCNLARNDERICAITAAMAAGTGLTNFSSKFYNRFFDVGIAEEHAVVFASGLARNGMLPVFAVYSSFLQRSYDQIIHDAALQRLNVVFAIDRAGIVGEDGETHQGIFDVPLMNQIPKVTILSPCCDAELRAFLSQAIYDFDGPTAIRYPRGVEPDLPQDFKPSLKAFDLYKEQSENNILIITYGRLFAQAVGAIKILSEKGCEAALLKLNRIKPLDPGCFEIASNYKNVFFFEESIMTGGIGEHFGMCLYQSGFKGKFRSYGIKDRFVPQGSVAQLLALLGLDAQGISNSILSELESLKLSRAVTFD